MTSEKLFLYAATIALKSSRRHTNLSSRIRHLILSQNGGALSQTSTQDYPAIFTSISITLKSEHGCTGILRTECRIYTHPTSLLDSDTEILTRVLSGSLRTCLGLIIDCGATTARQSFPRCRDFVPSFHFTNTVSIARLYDYTDDPAR